MKHHRGVSILVAVVVTAGAFLLAGSPAFAQYHSPGSLVCSGCHTMHNSVNGASVTGGAPTAHLLIKSNITDLCLTCHDTAGTNATFSSGGSTPPKVKGIIANVLPGGNYTNSFTTSTKGHSLAGTGWNAEATATSPGGNYLTANLSCTSCHEPHGDTNLGFGFRNLKKTVNGVLLTATEIASVDVTDEATLVTAGALADQNAAISATNHNVYKGEMGKWCGACHSNPDNMGTGFHGISKADTDVGNAVDWIRHPTGTAFTAGILTNYGTASRFDYPMVTTAAGATKGAEWTPLVAAESKVFCLSCHFAHASPYTSAVRWDLTAGSGGTDLNRAKCGRCHNK